jgi:ABC-2 type transport system permease protein
VRLIKASDEELAQQVLHREIPLYLTLRSDGLLTYKTRASYKDGDAARALVQEILEQSVGRQDKILTKIDVLDQTSSRYIDFLIPGLLALSLLTTSLFGTGMTIVSARRENLLKRYAATPLSPRLLVLSYILGRLLIFMLEFSTITLAGFLFFDFHVLGSFPLYLGVAALGVLAFTAMAMLLSSRMRNTGAYNGMVNLITLLWMFPAGIWFSKHTFPSWFAQLADLLPLTALVDALRMIAIDGKGLEAIAPQMAVLVVCAVGSGFVATKMFRF